MEHHAGHVSRNPEKYQGVDTLIGCSVSYILIDQGSKSKTHFHICKHKVTYCTIADGAMNRTLYIIGNGFDLAHKMKSSYRDFKEWLCRSGYNDYILIMQRLFPSVVDGEYLLWSDFENALELIEGNIVSKWSFEDMLLETAEGTYSFGQQEILDTYIQSIVSKIFISWVKSIEVAFSFL